ncbi:MAG TPA: M48 family metallopeptidase [Desulfomonilia bacterium]|nr:M48 family metallopeptidase [Desulfomonilia bacterium]
MMQGSATIFIRGVGEVLVEHSTRAQRVSITLKPSGVRVAVPLGVPLSRGKRFACDKRDWIRSRLSRLETMVRAQAEACSLLPMTDIVHARKKIISRLDELSARFDLPYAGAMVRNQRTRWGSCSINNTISLNINLARLPDELMDYVIVHELLHTKIRGHGREFWKGIDSLMGDSRGLRRRLKHYSLVLR